MAWYTYCIKNRKGECEMKAKTQEKGVTLITAIIMVVIAIVIVGVLIGVLTKKGGSDGKYYNVDDAVYVSLLVKMEKATYSAEKVSGYSSTFEEYLLEKGDAERTKEEGKWKLNVGEDTETGHGKDKKDVYMLEKDGTTSYNIVYYKTKNNSKIIDTIEE